MIQRDRKERSNATLLDIRANLLSVNSKIL